MSDRGWQRTRNILAYPFGWQRPARTEEWAYESCLAALTPSPFVQMVCFPWATLVDLLRKGKQEAAESYLSALRWIAPKTTLRRATVCQHIYAKDLWPIFKQLKITDVFWAHARRSEFEYEGVRIHSFPLYPVRYFHRDTRQQDLPFWERRFLYSFVGAHQTGLYERDTREWIFELPARDDAFVARRDEWHYERQVYGEQIEAVALTDAENREHIHRSDQYEQVMRETAFSLCPSGSGPNSIRLWEALGFGCIPVVLSDEYRPVGPDAAWREAVVTVKESRADVARLPEALAALRRDRERAEAILEAGRVLWASAIDASYISQIEKVLRTNLSEGVVGA